MTACKWTLLLALLAPLTALGADDRFTDVRIEATELAPGIHMLTGSGGNMGLISGRDGALLIDDQYLPLAERIRTVVVKLAGAGPRLLLNTHFHGDHTGGNSAFGSQSVILAHANVRARLAGNDALPGEALPVITFADRIRLHLNDQAIDVRHVPSAHTDGDSIVWLPGAGVAHLGDLFFNGRFPFIDQASGGSVEGYLQGLDDLLSWLPADTKIIPGHGPLADTEDLRAFAEMIRSTYGHVRERVAAGVALDALLEEGLDERWQGWAWEFIDAERWLRMLHNAAIQNTL